MTLQSSTGYSIRPVYAQSTAPAPGASTSTPADTVTIKKHSIYLAAALIAAYFFFGVHNGLL